ncbi:hypothetical protein ACIQ6R_16190 [Streptomyces sp. NPDC096048]|uniref:hypothetical protein n=1 Tax=Streptomyces sp. NPDC096048 TaxID=3366072 RepID=UPI0038062082
MTHVLIAVLTLSAGWCWGHRTARVRVIVIGATPQQDQAAIATAEVDRFWQVVDGLNLDHPDDPRSSTT